MLKKLFAISCLVVLAMVGTAVAEETTFDVSVTLAQPFAIDSTIDGNLGTIYVTGAAETLSIDASPVVPVQDGTNTNVTLVWTAATISRGGAPVALGAGQSGATVRVETVQADVDLAVALVGTPTLDIPFSAAPTPLTVTGISSNVATFNTTASPAGEFMGLAVGPIIDVPANAELGAYTGTITVDITAL